MTLDLAELLAVSRPVRTVSVNGIDIELCALSAKELDDLITAYPPPKGEDMPFSSDLRYELIAKTVTNVELSIEDVKKLYEAWSRSQVQKLQSACFELNWSTSESESLPLSETESEGTGGTP